MIQAIALALLLAPAAAQEKPKKAFVGVQIAQDEDKVVYVMGVINDSPAEKAGLKAGDALVKINDIKPPDIRTAVTIMQSLKPGKKVKFLVRREGKEEEVEVTPRALSE